MGVAATPAPKGLGPQNPTKKLAHVGVLLGHLLSQNRVPKVSVPLKFNFAVIILHCAKLVLNQTMFETLSINWHIYYLLVKFL